MVLYYGRKQIVASIFVFIVAMISLLLLSNVANCADEVAVNGESAAVYRSALDLFRKGDFAQALPLFTKAYKLDQRNTNALFAQGLTLDRLKQYNEAAGVYRTVLTVDPNHEKAMQALGQSLFEAGRFDEALEAASAGAKAYPKSYIYPNSTALVYLKQEKYKEAVPYLQKAIELKPDDLRIQYLLAQSLTQLGRSDDAVVLARAILAKNENDARARLIVADNLRESGKLEDAKAQYQIAARNIETKAYAEHYIKIIDQRIEELDIEREYEERMKTQ